MAIIDYSSLQTTVNSYLHRDDLAAMVPDFITLAEAKLNRRLRVRQMEVRLTASTTGSYDSLPTDFLEARSVWGYIGATAVPLEYVTPEQEASYQYTGQANAYTIVGLSIYWLPSPTSAFDYTLTYYGKIPALSDGANWLISYAPDVYLYATLLEAAPYLKNDQRIDTWNSLLDMALADIGASDKSAKTGGSSLAMRTDNNIRI